LTRRKRSRTTNSDVSNRFYEWVAWGFVRDGTTPARASCTRPPRSTHAGAGRSSPSTPCGWGARKKGWAFSDGIAAAGLARLRAACVMHAPSNYGVEGRLALTAVGTGSQAEWRSAVGRRLGAVACRTTGRGQVPLDYRRPCREPTRRGQLSGAHRSTIVARRKPCRPLRNAVLESLRGSAGQGCSTLWISPACPPRQGRRSKTGPGSSPLHSSPTGELGGRGLLLSMIVNEPVLSEGSAEENMRRATMRWTLVRVVREPRRAMGRGVDDRSGCPPPTARVWRRYLGRLPRLGSNIKTTSRLHQILA